MSPPLNDPDPRNIPISTAEASEDDSVRTRLTRPRLNAYAPPPATPCDAESPPPTLPLAKLRLLRPKPPADTPTPEVQPDALPAVARNTPVAVAVTPVEPPVEPHEPTLALHRKGATPTAPTAPTPQPRLRVLRGLKIDSEYPIYEGQNLIGRRDDQPVDIDLCDQEPADRIWASRQHALITYENGVLSVEDLHSLNGTFVNRHQIFPGQKRLLSNNDILQIGTIQLKVTF